MKTLAHTKTLFKLAKHFLIPKCVSVHECTNKPWYVSMIHPLNRLLCSRKSGKKRIIGNCNIEAGCSQEEGPKKGFVMGSRTQGVQKMLENIYIGHPHPHKPEPGGMGHMEQGHSQLFWVARALQLTPGTVI